jgi:hypothetical protein
LAKDLFMYQINTQNNEPVVFKEYVFLFSATSYSWCNF